MALQILASIPRFADDGGFPWWLPFVTPQLVVGVLIVLPLLLLIGGVLAFWLYRGAKRDSRVKRLLLLAQSQDRTASAGERDVTMLRLRLQDALSSAERALQLTSTNGSAPGDLRGILHRTQHLGGIMDTQLRLLRDEPDDRSLRQLLSPARTRVAEVEAVAGRIRQAAAASLEGEMGAEMPELKADAERELAALQAGVAELEAMTSGAMPLRNPDQKRALPGERGGNR